MTFRSSAFIFATLALFVTGCAPEFTIDNCVVDTDCFVGQQCTAQGTCIATSAEILGFSASETTVEPGEEVTLSWSTRAAASAVIESTDFTFAIDEDELDEGSTVVTVDDDMTFVLTVVGGRAETETREVEVTVEEPVVVDPEPEILNFSASEVEVMPGTTVTFEWEVEHADTIIVEQDGEVATTSEEPEGSFEVQITEATTFVLTASNDVGTATSDPIEITVVDVPVAPTVLNFEASETTDVLPGTTIDLTWEVDSADTVVITDNDGELLDTPDNAGQTSVEMNESQTFTLTATNDLGQDTATVDVTVLVIDSPVIVSFTASETDGLEPGDEVELTWEVTGADTVLIEDSAGAEYANTSDLTGSVTVTISQDLGTDDPDVDPGDFFRIVASNQGGDVAQEIPITVFIVPVIVSFTASQTVDVVADSDVTISWQVQGFDSISISTPQGEVASPTTSTGSFNLSITEDMDVTLEATNAVGTATATLSFTVIFVPTINSFTASPQTGVTPGDTVTLAWDVSNVNSIAVEDENGVEILSSGLSTGSFGVTVNADTFYTLKATNNAGDVSQTVSISTN